MDTGQFLFACFMKYYRLVWSEFNKGGSIDSAIA